MIITEKGVSDVYEFEEIIGEGAFSNVVLGTHNDTKGKYAIKIIDKENVQSALQRERVDREIEILRSCHHPNIVKFVEAYESDLEISVVMELMNGGDLFDRILSKGVFTEEEARTAMYNILSALDYLHDRCIVHRDLKPENLLYTTKDDSAILKISDFGLSKYSTEPEWIEPPCGTIAYIAPEVAVGSKVYRKVVDVWSCGCILYFMLFGKPPFYSKTEEEIYDLVSEGTYYFPEKPIVSDSVKELISFLLQKDPNKRYTTKQTLLHPWMTGRSRDHTTTPSKTQATTTTTTTTTTTITTTTSVEQHTPQHKQPQQPPPPPQQQQQPSTPVTINNLRVSLNSVIDSQRGPLTPPLASPTESLLWKKRAAKVRGATSLKLSGTRLELELEDSDDGEEDDDEEEEDDDDDDDDDSGDISYVKSGNDDDDDSDIEMDMMVQPSEGDDDDVDMGGNT